jgi:uncharacterized protein YjbI with pentapeptide repeats
VQVAFPVTFVESHFAETLVLRCCELPSLALSDCDVSGVDARYVTVKFDLSLYGSAISSTVDLTGARIGGALTCNHGRFISTATEVDFDATDAEVGGPVSFTDAIVRGRVIFDRATLKQLDCSFAKFTSVQVGLRADGAAVAGELDLSGACIGGVRLSQAILGDLNCNRANLDPEGTGGTPFMAEGAVIKGKLDLNKTVPGGAIDLSDTTTKVLDEGIGFDGLGPWEGKALLQGFEYDRFGGVSSWDAHARIQWLQHTTTYQAEAWAQLIKVYRVNGRDDDARKIAIAQRNDRLHRGSLSFASRCRERVLRWTIGYGYRPQRVLVWAALVIAGFALLVSSHPFDLRPTRSALGAPLQPVIYSADTFLPIIDLGEARRWQPTGLVRSIGWAVVVLGWVLSTIFVAGFTKIVRG